MYSSLQPARLLFVTLSARSIPSQTFTGQSQTLKLHRDFSATSEVDDGFKTVTVIGAGLMGAGIAQVTAASSHYRVNLVDMDEKALAKGLASITSSLQKKFKSSTDPSVDPAKQIEQIVSKITTTTNVEQAVSQSDLVIEAIVENLKVKRDLFSRIHKAAPKHTVLASNTSSLSITEISQGFRPDQFGGLHFFNPVPVMKLVEIIKTKDTSVETEKKFESYVKKIGKVGVKCSDTPGFIVNRLLVPYLMEAVRMYERGEATKEDIDTAMKLGCGYPMGPFSLLDYVGLDTTKYIMDGWSEKFPNEGLFKQSPMLNNLVKEGKLGNKSPKGGFYSK